MNVVRRVVDGIYGPVFVIFGSVDGVYGSVFVVHGSVFVIYGSVDSVHGLVFGDYLAVFVIYCVYLDNRKFNAETRRRGDFFEEIRQKQISK